MKRLTKCSIAWIGVLIFTLQTSYFYSQTSMGLHTAGTLILNKESKYNYNFNTWCIYIVLFIAVMVFDMRIENIEIYWHFMADTCSNFENEVFHVTGIAIIRF